MSADWIKMRTDLYRDPKVCMMAESLLARDSSLSRYVNQNCQRDMIVTRNVMRNVTVGALVSVWGVMRHRGKRVDDDLLIKNVVLDVIDDIADLPGFGFAMTIVGWAIELEEGIVFPEFFKEFNVEPDKEGPAKNAERQRRFREKSNALRNVDVTLQNNAREEKRREENKEKKEQKKEPSAEASLPSGFEKFWKAWPASGRKVAKSKCAKLWQREKLEPLVDLLVEHVTKMSVTQQWQDGFEPAPLTYLGQARWHDEIPPDRLAKPMVSGWWQSDGGIRAKAAELGLSALPGESMPSFRDRINAKLEPAVTSSVTQPLRVAPQILIERPNLETVQKSMQSIRESLKPKFDDLPI